MGKIYIDMVFLIKMKLRQSDIQQISLETASDRPQVENPCDQECMEHDSLVQGMLTIPST